MNGEKLLQSSMKFGKLIACLAAAVILLWRGSTYFDDSSTPMLELIPILMCAATSFFVILLGIAWTFTDPSEEAFA